MEFQVTEVFNSFIIHTFKSHVIRDFLLTHERKPVVIEKICEQVRKAEMSNIGRKFEIRRFTQLIEAASRMFADAALKNAEEKALSHAEMVRRMDESIRMENIEAEFESLQLEAESPVLVSRPGSVAN